MIFVASEKKNSTAKKRDIAPLKVNGQSHIILQQELEVMSLLFLIQPKFLWNIPVN